MSKSGLDMILVKDVLCDADLWFARSDLDRLHLPLTHRAMVVLDTGASPEHRLLLVPVANSCHINQSEDSIDQSELTFEAGPDPRGTLAEPH